ncbi:hypothetical protein CF319_g7955 [Tilletia indica]|nr:hypothetical protein CF319_g7955 [Tilletia indica]
MASAANIVFILAGGSLDGSNLDIKSVQSVSETTSKAIGGPVDSAKQTADDGFKSASSRRNQKRPFTARSSASVEVEDTPSTHYIETNPVATPVQEIGLSQIIDDSSSIRSAPSPAASSRQSVSLSPRGSSLSQRYRYTADTRLTLVSQRYIHTTDPRVRPWRGLPQRQRSLSACRESVELITS